MPQTMRERLAAMTPDQLQAMRRASAWGDKNDPRVAEQLAQFDNDQAEVMAIWEESWDDLAKAMEELHARQQNTPEV